MIRRNTIQKTIIAGMIDKMKHPTAEEIFLEIKKSGYPFTLPTVYRNLNLMVNDGDIKKIVISEQADRFDSVTRNHYHFRCSVCGKINDLPSELYCQELNKKCADVLGAEIDRHEIQFIGTCKECL